MAAQKPLYHFGRARSLEELRVQRTLYFSRGCPPVERDSAEGERFLLAAAMAMNYGFAFRLSTYASLTQIAARSFGAAEPRLVIDSPHNTIYEELVDGTPALVHRHNSCRVYPASSQPGHPVFGRLGRPLLLPGTCRTASYVCVPDVEAASGLNSTCHGAGATISDLARRGKSNIDPRGRTTLRFRYSSEEPATVPHLDDRGIDDVMQILARNRIARPVARLRPFAVLN
jgi:RNA-splicing ligase RtcB